MRKSGVKGRKGIDKVDEQVKKDSRWYMAIVFGFLIFAGLVFAICGEDSIIQSGFIYSTVSDDEGWREFLGA